MEEQARKKVDQDWKNHVEREKQTAQSDNKEYYEPTFKVFISSLSMQAMIAIGKLENPITKKMEKNMDQARYLIDTLGIIKEKTKGNLAEDEQIILDESLFNLRMMYIDDKGEK